jgi:hypothetical protein
MKRLVPLAAVLGVIALAGRPLAADGPQPPAPAQQQQAQAKHIDLVICLDVSGSMSGLLNSARARLWDIVNELAKIQPAPVLRVGLYSYGGNSQPGYDKAAGFVRKEVDLTTDLDLLYQKINALISRGSVEYVARATHAAVTEQKWSDQKDALKIIFVAGNEPASQDPQITLKQAADLAKSKGILVNPIFCGNAQTNDAKDWITYAELTGGRFNSIDQDKGVVVTSTPLDKKLVELGEKMNSTYVTYGKKGKDMAANQLAQDQNAYKAGEAVAAGRVATKNTGLYRCEEWDMVDRLRTDPKFDITKVPVEELPEALKKMTPEQRVAHVKQKDEERKTLQKQVADLNVQREAYIREQQKKAGGSAQRAFDGAIRETLRLQAKTRNIKIPE